MDKKIAVLRGDGIGPEIINAAITCLNSIAIKFGHKFEYNDALIGGIAIDNTGVPLPQDTIDICLKSDAVLLGAVGGPKWDNLAAHLRPEKGLLGIRSAMGLYANLRPAILYDNLLDASPLKNEIIKNGIDMIVVRELIGGIYFGPRGYRDGAEGQEAFDTEVYSIAEIERISKVAFEVAMGRRKKVVSVDKANVLDSSKLWRATVTRMSKNYPEVTLEHMLVDNCAMQIVKNPSQFDVLLCPNMFGDILSDEAAMVTGSIGLLPSSSLGTSGLALYEPIHGSAPDIAGTDTANPIATILAAGMMLSTSFDLHAETQCLDKAVKEVLKTYRTPDIFYETKKTRKVGCEEMAEQIALEILNS